MEKGRQRAVRFDRWIHDEVDGLAKEKGVVFTDMVNHLLEYQLNLLGFSKAQYEAKSFNLERPINKSGEIKIVNSYGKMGDISAKTGDANSIKNEYTPADNMGILGDIHNLAKKLSDDKREELRDIAIKLQEEE
jgi:hypothetical protein